MDLSKASTEELRAELHEREEQEKKLAMQQFLEQFPCPECGALPAEIRRDLVEEFRFAPRDDEGRPMLYAPYEMGSTNGVRYEDEVTCSNGHVTRKSEFKWFDEPQKGPPLLPS